MTCEACERGDHHLCGMQTWCECDGGGPDDAGSPDFDPAEETMSEPIFLGSTTPEQDARLLESIRKVREADATRAGKCERCNGTGTLCRCRRCGTLYRHVHKYSDCGNASCEGERYDDVPCPDCDGSGAR